MTDLLGRRVAALLRGETQEAWAARVASARAADALPCGRLHAEIAVTQAGATVAYRAGTLLVLQEALAAARAAL